MNTVKFKARVNVLISVDKKVSLKHFKTLHENDRYYIKQYERNNYYEILRDQLNPKIRKLKIILKKQKVKFKTHDDFVGGRMVTIFTTEEN